MASKRQTKEQRQGQIIQAALDCFTQKGYVNTSIDDIAMACKLSKGSIYWYFKSKDAILIQAIKEFTRNFQDIFNSFVQQKLSTVEKFNICMQHFISFHKQNQGLFNLFVEFWAQSKDREGIRKYWKELLMLLKNAVTDIIESGIKTGEFKKVDTESVVWGLMATLDGLGAYACLVDDLDVQSVLGAFSEIILHGLKDKDNIQENGHEN